MTQSEMILEVTVEQQAKDLVKDFACVIVMPAGNYRAVMAYGAGALDADGDTSVEARDRLVAKTATVLGSEERRRSVASGAAK